MKYFIVFLFIVSPLFVMGQKLERQTISACGQYLKVSAMAVSYNIGEPLTNTLSVTSNTLTQGFEQPSSDSNKIDIFSAVQNVKEGDFNARLYPNPADNKIILELSATNADNYTIQLYSIIGQKLPLVIETLSSGGKSTYNINLNALAAGPYFINVLGSDGHIAHSFKFIKTN